VGISEEPVIIWTSYLKYRAELRGFELSKIENILRHPQKNTLIQQPNA
jgi:hypothetical protein